MFIARMANKVQPLQTQRLTLFQQAHHGDQAGKGSGLSRVKRLPECLLFEYAPNAIN
jgi:hypothetical protein